MSKHPTGWRVWDVKEDERGLVLASPEFGRVLPGLIYPERVARAICPFGHRDPPQEDCSDGMYSADTFDGARHWTLMPGVRVAVTGRVTLLGRTFPGQATPLNKSIERTSALVDRWTGTTSSPEHRSAAVRLKGPQQLHPIYADRADELAKRYGVPFNVVDWLAEVYDPGGDLMAAGKRLLRSINSLACPCGESHWGTSAAGLLLFNEQRTHVVLQKRSQVVDHPKTWALIGGAIDPLTDPTPTSTALREACEEAGLDPALIHPEKEITPPRPECGGWAYTYVVATTSWTPAQDWVIPNSTTPEAEGAAWLPLDVLNHPSHYPKLALHPLLQTGWPAVRAVL